jgi:hypothetical protein
MGNSASGYSPKYPGNTIAGSSIRYTSTRLDWYYSGYVTPSGTWRAMGYTVYQNHGSSWVRIS